MMIVGSRRVESAMLIIASVEAVRLLIVRFNLLRSRLDEWMVAIIMIDFIVLCVSLSSYV